MQVSSCGGVLDGVRRYVGPVKTLRTGHHIRVHCRKESLRGYEGFTAWKAFFMGYADMPVSSCRTDRTECYVGVCYLQRRH